jgi:hypothetical protein
MMVTSTEGHHRGLREILRNVYRSGLREIIRKMAREEVAPLDKIDVPIELMERVGLLDDPELTPYFQREDVELTTERPKHA